MDYTEEKVPQGYVLNHARSSASSDTKYGNNKQFVHCAKCCQDIVTEISLDPASLCTYLVILTFLSMFFGCFSCVIVNCCYHPDRKIQRTHRCPICRAIVGKSKVR